MLDNTPNQPSNFRTISWVEINDDSREVHNTNIQIKFKCFMSSSSLYNHRNLHILVRRTITVPNTEATGAYPDDRNKEVIFKNCAPFTDCTSEINNTEIDHAKNIDVVMPMYDLIEYSDNYLKASGSLWQYYRDEHALTNILSYCLCS